VKLTNWILRSCATFQPPRKNAWFTDIWQQVQIVESNFLKRKRRNKVIASPNEGVAWSSWKMKHQRDKTHSPWQPVTRVVHAVPHLIEVIAMVSSDWTKEASQRGRSAIVVETAHPRIFAVKLDLWSLCVEGCRLSPSSEKMQMMVFAWSIRQHPNQTSHACNDWFSVQLCLTSGKSSGDDTQCGVVTKGRL
jgi:hypothetical protein